MKVAKYDFCMHEPNEKCQYRLMFLFPRELSGNPVLKEGILNATTVFDKWINVTSEMKRIEKICDDMPFEVQKEPYKEKVKTLTSKKYELEGKMNKDLAPYFWEIHEKISTEYDRFEIKADYGLALQKRNKDWDE